MRFGQPIFVDMCQKRFIFIKIAEIYRFNRHNKTSFDDDNSIVVCVVYGFHANKILISHINQW